MEWRHEASLEWLKDRQHCLTATDVKNLLPFTKSGRKRTIDQSDYLKVWASKQVALSVESCKSSGAAARGHILEPWAVQMYNDMVLVADKKKLVHWDDIVVTRPKHNEYELAFSPDAMTEIPADAIFRSKIGTSAIYISKPGLNIEIGEVKSYNPERHMICGYSKKSELEERWQLAVAMAVLPEVSTAHLMFFNPAMRNVKMFLFDYTRADLADEIATVLEVEENWIQWINSYMRPTDAAEIYGGASEEEILAKIADLNPPK